IAFTFFGWDRLTFGHFLRSLCCSYAVGFTALGLVAYFHTDGHYLNKHLVTAAILLGSVALAYVLWLGYTGENTDMLVPGFFMEITRFDFDDIMYDTFAGVILLAMGTYFACHGVLAVVVAYFRKNYHRIFLSLKREGSSRLKNSAYKLFQVPYIIDVKEIILHPTDIGKFNFTMFRNILLYEVVAGLVIASYLLLNPVMLGEIGTSEMMIILMLISLFVCTLVIPVSIVKALGVEAGSDAPRPYVLWKGMKDRIFHGSFYIALFLTLLWVSLYVGVDSTRVTNSYLGYIFFMVLMSCMVTFVYTNSFYIGFRNGIIRNFEDAEKKE
ncbi:MAG: hypothetical protein MJZ68_06325, partial [archaeon]|nr:hypothetical protein [archaeon]